MSLTMELMKNTKLYPFISEYVCPLPWHDHWGEPEGATPYVQCHLWYTCQRSNGSLLC